MANNNSTLNMIASALVVDGLNNAMSQATKKTAAEIKKTQEFKDARKQATVDSMIWKTQLKAIKDANTGASDEDIENAAMSMGYNKPETETETVERLQQEFLNASKGDKAAEYAGQLMEANAAMGFVNGFENALANIDTAIQTPTPSYTTRTYYTGREQYEAHRAITRNNIENKRGASCAERIDSNMNAFSEHLEIFARKFKR